MMEESGMTLVEFIKARVAEDERAAKAAYPGPWRHNPDKHWRKPGTAWFEEAVFAGPASDDAVCIAGTGETDDPQSMADARHIARHDPARVLREMKALRRIVELHTPQDYGHITYADGHTVVMDWACFTCRSGEMDGDGAIEPDPAPCDTLRALALIWSAHPDYREDWAL